MRARHARSEFLQHIGEARVFVCHSIVLVDIGVLGESRDKVSIRGFVLRMGGTAEVPTTFGCPWRVARFPGRQKLVLVQHGDKSRACLFRFA